MLKLADTNGSLFFHLTICLARDVNILLLRCIHFRVLTSSDLATNHQYHTSLMSFQYWYWGQNSETSSNQYILDISFHIG